MNARRSADPNIAEIAALIGDRGRAAMLLALLDGRDLAASELASVAGMTPQAATAHFKKLVAAGLIVGRKAIALIGHDFTLGTRGREIFGEVGIDLDDVQAERRRRLGVTW